MRRPRVDWEVILEDLNKLGHIVVDAIIGVLIVLVLLGISGAILVQ